MQRIARAYLLQEDTSHLQDLFIKQVYFQEERIAMKILNNNYKFRSLRKEMLGFCLLCAWAVQMGAPQSSASDIQDLICRGIPGLNEQQIQICKQVPRAINVLQETQRIFESECAWQFRKEQWNCTGVNMSVFSAPKFAETKESGFVYALTSALAVHQITKACSDGDLSPVCGCDISRNGITTPQGWKWGSCSDNISYGVVYAQNFLDARELNKTNSKLESVVAQGEVHLHNNGAGRRVVQDGVKLMCRCHGLSGSCSTKTCWEETPTVYEIGDTMKILYDRARKVEFRRSNSNDPAVLSYFNTTLGTYVIPSTAEMVYLDESPRYCAANSTYTKQRQCMPQSALVDFNNTDMDKYFPPCESFCCNGQYEAYHKTEVTSCDCTFVWCCEVQCATCVANVTEYKCTG